MSFGENIGYYRRRGGITQEQLAERLFVTRQTVSRWETDAVLPDVETLVRLCDLFSCDMDTLVRGDAAAEQPSEPAPSPSPDSLPLYDRHMNRFSLAISLGVLTILLGVTLLILLSAFPWGGVAGVIALLALIAAAVVVFIVAGLRHEGFMREHPHMSPYPEERRRAFLPRMTLMIAGATALIFVGIILLILLLGSGEAPTGVEIAVWEHLSAAIFMLTVSIAVFLYVMAGMLHSKYEVSEYNRECVKEGFAPPEESTPRERGKQIAETLSSVIMLAATAVFLLFGFLADAWHPAWVAFPIGAILTGIASAICEAFFKK